MVKLPFPLAMTNISIVNNVLNQPRLFVKLINVTVNS